MEILFTNIDKGINCKIFHYLFTSLQYKTICTSQQPKPWFVSLLPMCIIVFPIIDQCRYLVSLIWWGSYDQTLSDFEQHKQSFDQKMSMGPYVGNICFPQFRLMKVSGYTGDWYKIV